MDTNQKVILAVLILAIVFSVVSMFISLSLSDLSSDFRHVVSGKVSDNGGAGVSLVVEGASSAGGGG
ncbi:hypothetical protein HY450_02450 [Candidatus Pacearchaeota archaeon]|nr:hypothetical protein [Candidatus Pacearchaeota archaeon]